MKKLLSTLFLALVASVGIIYASDTQVNGIWYDFNKYNKTAIVTYRGSSNTNYSNEYSGSVVIPSSVTYNGITYSVTSIGESAFYRCYSLTSVTIPSSVTSIGYAVFAYCSSLTSITIPNSVTSIGEWAFEDCSSLTSVTIPNSVTSIGDYAFWDCSSLTSVHITDLAAWCNIDFGGYSANPLYFAHDLYLNGELVKDLVIPNNVTSIGDYAFSGCSSLTSITIPNGVTSIGDYAFRDCSSLTSITIPNSVTSIGNYAFWDCSSLTSITIPNSVTSIGYGAFEDCSSLTSITIPNSVTSIGDYAFSDCSSLTSVTIPNSVTSIGSYAFDGCKSLTSVTIPNSVTSIGKWAFGDCSSLTSVTIPNSVTSIGSSTFSGCSSLASVTIGDGVTSIGNYAFYNCSSLTSPVYNAHCFAYMPTSYSGAYAIPEGIKQIAGGAFFGCSSLTSVTIPNCVTSIGDQAFEECSNITSVIWNAKNCSSYNFGSQVTSFEFGNEVEVVPSSLCKGMEKLTSITIPNSVISIGSSAFEGCSNITSVAWNAKNCNSYNFGSQVTSFEFGNEVEVVPSSLCNGMEKLTSVAIPNSVKTIGSSAFKGCARLGEVSLGKGLETIGANAFAECTRLYDIYSYATYPPFAKESSFANYNVYVYIPCEYQRDYTLDVVWGKFKFIECISSDNVTTDEIVVTPSENEANVIWPSVNGAASYELVIKDKDGNIVCTLIFNANGQLTSIAFNAPSRNGAPAQTQNAGFSFTITGLDSGTGYDLTLTAKDNSGNIIEETTIPFHTDYPEGIENVHGDEVQSTKVIKDGQVLILRNGKTYTMQGQEVK